MLRVCETHLSKKNKRFYFKNKIFYGLSYGFNKEGLLKSIKRIINGESMGVCGERLNVDDRETPRVNFDCLIDSDNFYEGHKTRDYEDSQYIFGGKLFQGYAYIFNDEGILVTEASFDDGSESDPYLRYYPTGSMEVSRLGCERKEWHEDGSLKRQSCYGFDVESGVGTGLQFSVHFDERGKLNYFHLEKDYPFNLDELNFVTLAEDLILSGSGINDKVLEILGKKQSYLNVRNICIKYSDNITEEKILGNFSERINSIRLTANKNINKSIVDKIKKNYPDCFVYYGKE